MKAWIISDTHVKHGLLNVPKDIDIVFHAGDMGSYRDPYMNVNGVLDFLAWYRNLNIPHKILTCGNHDTSIERGLISPKQFEGITFLNHEYAEVVGLKIFGSPFQPSFGHGWAYNVPRSKIQEYWKDIPNDLDILITHGPPKGILDLTQYDSREGAEGKAFFQCGCEALLERIQNVKPKRHIFGHIHPEKNCPNAGIYVPNGSPTTFINAAVLNLDYNIDNHGVVIEI